MSKIAFDRFEIDLDLYRVHTAGKDIGLGGRPLDLLVYLIRHRHRFLSKEEIRQDVWEGAALSAATIPTAIMQLRRMLGDDPKAPRIIVSKRGRGYRFETEVQFDSKLRRARHEGFERLPFAAREFELECVEQAARSVRLSGCGRVVLVAGVAGVGKTRLLDEISVRLAPQMRTLVSRCSAIEGAPPFWAFTQLIKLAIREEPNRGDEFFQNVGQLSAVHPELPRTTTIENTEPKPIDRFALFGLWLKTIKSLARSQPQVIAFEDIHLADRDSLDLLACLAEEIEDSQILLIATHRPATFDDERRTRLGEVATAPQAQTFGLAPFSPAEVSALLDAHGEHETDIHDEIQHRSQGIPFYITQMLRSRERNAGEPSSSSANGEWRIDGKALVARQLSDLDEHTREALGIASLIGEQFTATLLASVLDVSTSEIVRTIAPAVQTRLIIDRTVEFEFSHRLLRDALHDSLDPATRRRIHLAIARKLVALGDSHQRPARVSDHLNESAPICQPDELIRYSELAAIHAEERFAYSEATRYFRRALRTAEQNPAADPQQICSLMISLAAVILYAGDPKESRSLLLSASRIARSAGLPSTLARIALQLAPEYLEIEIGANDIEQISLLKEALHSLDRSETALRSMTMARLSQALQWSHCPDQVEGLASEALELAEESRDPAAIEIALTARAESLNGPANAHTRLLVLTRLAEVAVFAPNYAMSVLTHARLLTANFELGDIRAVERENRILSQLTKQADLPEYNWYPAAHDAALCIMRGRLGEARALSSTVREYLSASQSRNCAQTVAAHDALIAFEKDSLPALIPHIRKLAHEEPTTFYWKAAYVLALVEAGDHRGARQISHEFRGSDLELMACEPGGGLSLALLTESLSTLGEEQQLKPLFEILIGMTDRCATIGYGIGYFGSLARYAGIAARSIGKTTEAVSLLLEAIDHETTRGAVSWRAYAEADLADSLAATGRYEESLAHRLRATAHELQDSELERAARKVREATMTFSSQTGPAES